MESESLKSAYVSANCEEHPSPDQINKQIRNGDFTEARKSALKLLEMAGSVELNPLNLW